MSNKPPTPIKEQEENKGDKPNTTPLEPEQPTSAVPTGTELPTGVQPVELPGVQPVELPGVLPAEQPGNEQPGVQQPGVLPVELPGVLPAEQPGNEQPGVLPVEQPGVPAGNEQQFQPGNEQQQQGQQFQFGNEQQQQVIEQPGNEQPETKNITVTIDKSTLVSLSQNLNINLLVTISAYKNVLSKLTEIVTNPDKQTKINANIEMLNGIEKSVTELLGSVQENLEIPADKLISASKILEEVNKGNNAFTNTTLQIDAATILAFLGTAIAMTGGKKTKGRRKNVHKKTKRNKQ